MMMARTRWIVGLAALFLASCVAIGDARTPSTASAHALGPAPGFRGSVAGPLQEPPEVALDGPALVLADLPFTLELERPAAEDESSAAAREPVTYTVVTSGGRELGRVELAPGATDTLTELELAGEDFPLSVRADGAVAATFDVAVVPGWVSILPPLVAIAMALIFREVVVSLFFGVWLGGFFFAGMDPLAATWRTVDRFVTPALADGAHASIIVFSLLLGGMVGVIAKCGGTQGIVNAVRPLATTPRRAQFATYLAGLGIFFDDYANTLIVGNTMRPITDRMKVSREKLAYIVDSTAAPIAAIVFVSTWVGFEISLIGDGLAIAAEQAGTDPALAAELLDANPFTVFIHSIPYLFYPILALVLVGMIIFFQRDFGPMLKAENRASRGEGLYREDAMLMADTSGGAMEPVEDAPERWYNAAVPVLTVIFVVLLGLYFGGRAVAGPDASLWDVFGASDPFASLLWGSLAGCIAAIGLAVGQRILSVQDAVEAWLGGMRAMMLAAVILVLAWSLSEVTQVLGTAPFLSSVLSEGLPPFLLPVLVFVTSAAIAFATGTSWGTMGILLPLVIPLAVSLGGGVGFEGGANYTILLGSISSVLAGAIFGDHCSPISDTTVLSSMAAGCDHVDHVRTQLPYAMLVGVVGMAVGDIPTALGLSPLVSYAVGIGLLYLALRFFGEYDHASPQWEGVGPPSV
jgi:Na+/H+ antiporter NhaC